MKKLLDGLITSHKSTLFLSKQTRSPWVVGKPSHTSFIVSCLIYTTLKIWPRAGQLLFHNKIQKTSFGGGGSLPCITSTFLGCSFWALLFSYKITLVTLFKWVIQSLNGLVFQRGASALSASRKQDWLWADCTQLLFLPVSKILVPEHLNFHLDH